MHALAQFVCRAVTVSDVVFMGPTLSSHSPAALHQSSVVVTLRSPQPMPVPTSRITASRRVSAPPMSATAA
eukprot:6685987-Pyramimonas_sp.AAC.1